MPLYFARMTCPLGGIPNTSRSDNVPMESGAEHGGEQYFALMRQAYGCSVEKAASTEYDRLVQGTKCEVKTCCSDYSDGTHMHVSFEQIRVYQDYDMLIGQVVTPKCVRLFAIPHSVTLGWAQNGTIKKSARRHTCE